MTIKGLEPLLAMRQAGKLPGRNVIIFTDSNPSLWCKYGDCIGIPEGRVTLRDDMRVLLRLDVILVADRFTADVAKIIESIRAFAASVVFIALNCGDGTVWDRARGERPL